MAVPYWELIGSPTEQYTPDGSFIAKRRLMCAWGDRYQLVTDLQTAAQRVYPYITNYDVHAVGATIIPFGDNPAAGPTSDQIQYDSAIVTATYAIASYYPRAINGQMIIEEMHPWLEYRTLPVDKSHMGSAGGASPGNAPRVLVSGFDYTLTMYDKIRVNAAAIDLMGKWNQAAWGTWLLGLAFPIGKLLYLGPSPSVTARLGYTNKMSISLAFKYRNVEWTKELTGNGWQDIYDDDGNLLYQGGDFTQLYPNVFVWRDLHLNTPAVGDRISRTYLLRLGEDAMHGHSPERGMSARTHTLDVPVDPVTPSEIVPANLDGDLNSGSSAAATLLVGASRATSGNAITVYDTPTMITAGKKIADGTIIRVYYDPVVGEYVLATIAGCEVAQ